MYYNTQAILLKARVVSHLWNIILSLCKCTSISVRCCPSIVYSSLSDPYAPGIQGMFCPSASVHLHLHSSVSLSRHWELVTGNREQLLFAFHNYPLQCLNNGHLWPHGRWWLKPETMTWFNFNYGRTAVLMVFTFRLVDASVSLF